MLGNAFLPSFTDTKKKHKKKIKSATRFKTYGATNDSSHNRIRTHNDTTAAAAKQTTDTY